MERSVRDTEKWIGEEAFLGVYIEIPERRISYRIEAGRVLEGRIKNPEAGSDAGFIRPTEQPMREALVPARRVGEPQSRSEVVVMDRGDRVGDGGIGGN